MPNEFFYIDENGKKSDAALHEPILAEGDDEAAFQALVPFLRRSGWTDAEIERVYKKDNYVDDRSKLRSQFIKRR